MKRKISRGKDSKIESVKNFGKFSKNSFDNICKKQYGFLWLILIGLSFFYIGLAWGKKQTSPENSVIENITSFVEEISNPKELFKNSEKDKPEKVDFGIFWNVWNKVTDKHIDSGDLDHEAMVYGAIKGMVKSIEDPYTTYMDPVEAEEFAMGIEGSFEGIGAELGMRDNMLTVVAPISGMPAEKAGLKAGDKIIKINDEITSDITIDEAVRKIRGPKGTEVTLTVIGEEAVETKEIKIVRDTIELESVNYEQKSGNIAYFQITSFTEDTAEEFNKEITKVIADNNKGMILDLRNNPGGFLNVAIEIASRFVPRGSVVVQEKHRNGTVEKFESIGGNVFSETPVVILINEGSASASEILAGALRDVNGSKLIGEQSFGKGSVQQLEEFPDGSSLKVTIAKWLTPSGLSISEKGLEVDIEVKLTEEDIKSKRDAQLNKALEEIRKEIQNKAK